MFPQQIILSNPQHAGDTATIEPGHADHPQSYTPAATPRRSSAENNKYAPTDHSQLLNGGINDRAGTAGHANTGGTRGKPHTAAVTPIKPAMHSPAHARMPAVHQSPSLLARLTSIAPDSPRAMRTATFRPPHLIKDRTHQACNPRDSLQRRAAQGAGHLGGY